MNQNELREKLNDTIANGLMAKAIASKTKITTDILMTIINEKPCAYALVSGKDGNSQSA